jgi:hypothetical protein
VSEARPGADAQFQAEEFKDPDELPRPDVLRSAVLDLTDGGTAHAENPRQLRLGAFPTLRAFRISLPIAKSMLHYK